jgi:hypothetical protein
LSLRSVAVSATTCAIAAAWLVALLVRLRDDARALDRR